MTRRASQSSGKPQLSIVSERPSSAVINGAVEKARYSLVRVPVALRLFPQTVSHSRRTGWPATSPPTSAARRGN